MRRMSIVIADRHPVVLQGLASVLRSESDFKIVASCNDAASCIEAISVLSPDIAIMDAAMLEKSAPRNAAIEVSEHRSTHFVFFTAAEDRDIGLADFPAEHSVVFKETTGHALVQTLRDIARGHTAAPPSAAEQGVRRHRLANPEASLAMLTERERQIMRLVSHGLSNKAIGRKLHIADGTIKVHLHNIFQKLDIRNRTTLAALAISRDDQGSAG